MNPVIRKYSGIKDRFDCKTVKFVSIKIIIIMIHECVCWTWHQELELWKNTKMNFRDDFCVYRTVFGRKILIFLSAMVSVIIHNFSRSKHVNFDASLFRFLWVFLGISFKGISISFSAWSSRWFPSKKATGKSIARVLIIDFAISFSIWNESSVVSEPYFSYIGRYKTIT